MKRLSLALSLSILSACSGGSGPGANGASVCVASCPKTCAKDSDCQVGNGELCCDYGSNYGKVCQVSTAFCPRFCSADSTCDTTNGETCCKATAQTTLTVCSKSCVTACSTDAQCPTGALCETAFINPVCVTLDNYFPKCSTSSDCKTAGHICCTTFSLTSPNLVARGVGACIDPAGPLVCPKACTMSSDCSGTASNICCNGHCDTTCQATCTSDNSCPQGSPICCGAAALNSPFFGH
jgi:hypothetical protein